MKIAKYFFSLAILFLTFNCTSGKTVAVNAPQTKANDAVQNSSDTEENQLSIAAQTNAQQTTPEALLKDLYRVHAEDFKRNTDRIINGKSRTYLDKYFDKNLADLIWKDLTAERDGVGVIDFDLFYAAQDMDIKNLVVGQAKITGDTAIVPVTFANYGQKEKLSYTLTQNNNGAWKISDISYGTGDTLLKYFKEDALNNTALANFEGTFQVGTTTCTVKAVEMGFELRWAKGAGAMTFFFQGNEAGKFVFSSEDEGSGQDKFIFDNETLTNGKFVRADGREMPVKKIK